MSELPPDAAALLERARHAHGPSRADRERVLSGLHATLGVSTAVAVAAGTAASASATASAAEGAALAPSALGMKGALVGWKGALLSWNAGKVMLATVAIGSAVGVGSVALQTSTNAAREQRGAAVASAANDATRTAQRLHEASASAVASGDSVGTPTSATAQRNSALPARAAARSRGAAVGAPPDDLRNARAVAGERAGASLRAGEAARREVAVGATAVGPATEHGARSARRSSETQFAPSVRAKGGHDRTASERAADRTESRGASRHRSAARSVRSKGRNEEPAVAESETAAVAAQVAEAARPAEEHEAAAATTAAARAAATAESGVQIEHTGEVSLLRRALTSLRDDDAARALSLLADHAARYPRGAFTTERRGLRVLALCAAGLHAEGRREQSAFLSEAGSSPIAARVRTACAKDAK